MVSIFIPVYNGEHYLRRTLDSVLSQTYADWELLLVDDSSTDASYALLQEYAQSDPRLKVHRKPNGGDVPHAWEYAIPHLQGDFTLYMSQDDTLAPDCLALLVERQQQTEADAVLPHEVFCYSDGRPDEGIKGINGDTSPVITGIEAFRLMIDYSISGRALWRTEVIRREGITTETFNADELAQRLWAAACRTVAFSEGKFYYHRGNPNSITECLSPRHFEDVLTNARLLEAAQRLLPLADPLLRHMATAYFQVLYRRMLLFLQEQKGIDPAQRMRIRYSFRQSYHLLHRDATPSGHIMRLGTVAYPFFQMIALRRFLRMKYHHIPVSYDIDTIYILHQLCR